MAGAHLGEAQPCVLARLLDSAGPEVDPRQSPAAGLRNHTLGGAGVRVPTGAGTHHGASLDEIT